MRQSNDKLLRCLVDGGVDFVIVGGIAAIAHGALRTTLDLDIVAAFNRDNMARLLTALRDLHPRNSARPDLGELQATPEELARYRNLYLVTDVGELDILGELPPVGTPRQLRPLSMLSCSASAAPSSGSITSLRSRSSSAVQRTWRRCAS